MSRILVDQVRSNSASGDAITLDSSGKCAINATTINSLTFPTSDGSANQVIKTDGSGALSFVAQPSGGLEMAEIWRVPTAYSTSGGNTVYPTTWERDDTAPLAGNIGSSGMSQSGGVWTFPSTGIYYIQWQGYGYGGANSNVSLFAHGIYATSNNSSYSQMSINYVNFGAPHFWNYGWGSTQAIIDVTDISNVKAKLSNYSADSMTWEVGSTTNYNSAIFLKLGDT